MPLATVILTICWTLSCAQSPPTPVTARIGVNREGTSQNDFASNCTALYQHGTTRPYKNTSIAAVFQPFCSIRQNISQCYADIQQNLVQGDNPLQWSIGLSFDKRVFDVDSLKLCNSLPSVAEDLECLKSNEISTCGSILSSALPPVFQQFRNGTISQEMAQVSICRALYLQDNCESSLYSNCSKGANQFRSNYLKIWYGKCASGSILEALPPEIKNSVFVTCLIDSFSVVIENIVRQVDIRNLDVSSLMPFISSLMQELCPRTEEFSVCLVQRARNTTNAIDLMILQFVNVSNIKQALDLLCRSGQAFGNAGECLADLPVQGKFCVDLYFGNRLRPNRRNGLLTTLPTVTPSTDLYLRKYCPSVKQLVDCIYLPLSRCHPSLTSTMNNIVNILMTDRCRRLADQTSLSTDLNPTASVFIKCGFVIYIQIAKELRNGTGTSILDGLQSYIDVACRNAEWYISCVDKRILSSNNVMDRFAREILDFSSSVDRKQIAADVCKDVPDIKSNFKCLSQIYLNNSFAACIQKSHRSWEIFNNLTRLANMNGNMIRSSICKPIEVVTSCVRTSIRPCSTTVDSLMARVPKAILRTDCGGVRISSTPIITTTNPNKSGNNGGKPNKADHLKEDTLLLGTIVITIFVLIISG